MGNAYGRNNHKTVKIMKINGETVKYSPPIKAGDIVKNYPGHVLLESVSVKHHGIRAEPIHAHQHLEPRSLYFLVELPQAKAVPGRVRSGIQMTAKDRLESLMLARRSASDITAIKQKQPVRVRMRVPKAEVRRLVNESRDDAEVVEKILDLCVSKSS